MRGKRLCTAGILAVLFFIGPPLLSSQTAKIRLFTLDVENDNFVGHDRSFSSGVKFSWLTELSVSKAQNPDLRRFVSFSFGQNVYTPDNIKETALIPDDRPYAGYLYMGIGFHSVTNRRKDSWELSFGTVGPNSLAEQTQKIFHQIINDKEPKGWGNQLNNEMTLQVHFERRWKGNTTSLKDKMGMEIIPHLGGGAGNVYTYANAGFQIRLGWNLPPDFGTGIFRPGGDSPVNVHIPGVTSFHMFAAFDGQAVLRNIFLDGNTFTESHKVEKNNITGTLCVGVVLQLGTFRLSYSNVYWTKKFKTELQNHKFGKITVSFNY